MLPSHVKIIMLSATVPNCEEFADWVGYDYLAFLILDALNQIFVSKKRSSSDVGYAFYV